MTTETLSKKTDRGKCKMYYNYLVIKDEIEYRFRMTSEITEKFNIPTNTIFHIINKKNKKKWMEYKIIKIKEPVYALRQIYY